MGDRSLDDEDFDYGAPAQVRLAAWPPGRVAASRICCQACGVRAVRKRPSLDPKLRPCRREMRGGSHACSCEALAGCALRSFLLLLAFVSLLNVPPSAISFREGMERCGAGGGAEGIGERGGAGDCNMQARPGRSSKSAPDCSIFPKTGKPRDASHRARRIRANWPQARPGREGRGRHDWRSPDFCMQAPDRNNGRQSACTAPSPRHCRPRSTTMTTTPTRLPRRFKISRMTRCGRIGASAELAGVRAGPSPPAAEAWVEWAILTMGARRPEEGPVRVSPKHRLTNSQVRPRPRGCASGAPRRPARSAMANREASAVPRRGRETGRLAARWAGSVRVSVGRKSRVLFRLREPPFVCIPRVDRADHLHAKD
eukprot:353364-Chlamydomonas_euryale.AAC.7